MSVSVSGDDRAHSATIGDSSTHSDDAVLLACRCASTAQRKTSACLPSKADGVYHDAGTEAEHSHAEGSTDDDCGPTTLNAAAGVGMHAALGHPARRAILKRRCTVSCARIPFPSFESTRSKPLPHPHSSRAAARFPQPQWSDQISLRSDPLRSTRWATSSRPFGRQCQLERNRTFEHSVTASIAIRVISHDSSLLRWSVAGVTAPSE